MHETGYVAVGLLSFVFLCFIVCILYMQCKEYYQLCNQVADLEFELIAMDHIIKHNMQSSSQLFGSRFNLINASSTKSLLPSKKSFIDPQMDKEYFV